jgi:hypothetical protein
LSLREPGKIVQTFGVRDSSGDPELSFCAA